MLYTLFSQIFTSGPLMLALVVWAGHIFRGASIKEQLLGAGRVAMGVIGLSAGANLLIGVLGPLQDLLKAATGLTGYMPGCYMMYATAMGIPDVMVIFGGIFIGGFLLHLLIARITPYRYVYLTPHGYLWIITGCAVPLAQFKISPPIAIAIGSIISGLYYTYSCAVAHYDFKVITKGEKVTIGHPGGTTYFLAGLAGRLFKGTKKAEEVTYPKAFDWMKDINISTSVVMTIMLLALVLAVPPGRLEVMGIEIAIALHPILWAIVSGLTFGAGIMVLIMGVRLMLREITVAFEGISRKVIPGGMPGLDCPVSFPYAETAVMIGFISGIVGSLITSLILVSIGWMFIIPPVVEDFFMAGTCGVYGDAHGGWKGAILGGLMKGSLLILLPAISAFFTSAFIAQPITHADADACLVTILTYLLLGIFGRK